MLAVTMGVANATSPILQPSTSTPADNATGVAANANIVLTFDVAPYNLNPGPIVELYDSSNTLIESFTASGGYSMDGSNGGNGSITSNQVTLVLGAPLTNGTYHIVIPTTTKLYDTAATNRAVAVTDATTYNFTVESVSPPPVNAPIDLHFSKQVESYSTDIELK